MNTYLFDDFVKSFYSNFTEANLALFLSTGYISQGVYDYAVGMLNQAAAPQPASAEPASVAPASAAPQSSNSASLQSASIAQDEANKASLSSQNASSTGVQKA